MVFWPNTKINGLQAKTASLSAAEQTNFISSKAPRRIFVWFKGFS